MTTLQKNNSQVVLGYQIRIAINQLVSLWSQERRNKYLLNSSIEFPLSADSSVWPVADRPTFARQLFDDFEPGANRAPNGLGLFHLMKKAIYDGKPLSKNAEAIIAIGAESGVANHLREKRSFATFDEDDVPREPHVQLLGFDVCDEWLLSGLMNCGMTASHQVRLRRKFFGKVNLHGLFDDYGTASDYSLAVSKIAPEHAPFFPVSIFMLGQKRA